MYQITKKDDYLVVRFQSDFNYAAINAIIQHETALPEYSRLNDIWLIGPHHALVSLGDLETWVADFIRFCPSHATRQKTAIVVDPGLTETIVQLWVEAADCRVPFACRMFHSVDAAEDWLGKSNAKAAQTPSGFARRGRSGFCFFSGNVMDRESGLH